MGVVVVRSAGEAFPLVLAGRAACGHARGSVPFVCAPARATLLGVGSTASRDMSRFSVRVGHRGAVEGCAVWRHAATLRKQLRPVNRYREELRRSPVTGVARVLGCGEVCAGGTHLVQEAAKLDVPAA